MGYGRVLLEKRTKDPAQFYLSNGGVLLNMVAELLDLAYEKGVEEALIDLRTIRLNMRSPHPAARKAVMTYTDNAIKRLEERIGKREPETFSKPKKRGTAKKTGRERAR